MLTYTLRRILGAGPMLLFLLTLTFFLLRLAPGGPFDSDRVWPPEIEANIQQRYGLDRPVYVQFFDWLGGVAQGDLKESFQHLGVPVAQIITEALPASVLLGSLSLLFAILMGIPLGCLAAWRRNTWIDHTATLISVSGVSLPSFLVASILILIFSFWLGWLPPALFEGPGSLILPMATLGWRPMAMIARLTRASMLEAMSSDYVRVAYAKGLSSFQVVFKHGLKNSLVPVLAVMGPVAANLVTGSFLVEVVFQIPGLGKHFVGAVLNRDYPLVMGVTLVYGVILIGANLVVDLLYGWVDPRIRLE